MGARRDGETQKKSYDFAPSFRNWQQKGKTECAEAEHYFESKAQVTFFSLVHFTLFDNTLFLSDELISVQHHHSNKYLSSHCLGYLILYSDYYHGIWGFSLNCWTCPEPFFTFKPWN